MKLIRPLNYRYCREAAAIASSVIPKPLLADLGVCVNLGTGEVEAREARARETLGVRLEGRNYGRYEYR